MSLWEDAVGFSYNLLLDVIPSLIAFPLAAIDQDFAMPAEKAVQPGIQALRQTPQDAPPAYAELANDVLQEDGGLSANDPRSTSQESLLPDREDSQDSRRTLLAIYIHGFMGDETSFQSFPAHVHKALTILLAETHVVHTKLYPRYRSKRNISFARDDFSKWLAPHEGPKVDVVLLGHSMGGLVSAEVATHRSQSAAGSVFKHRILGTINFDVPFLGMHPGIISSGLASLFRSSDDPPAPETQETAQATSTGTSRPLASASSAGSKSSSQPQDPNYNPSFANDVILPVRKGWSNALHFLNKHQSRPWHATKQLIASHMEFGGAMANYPELKARYAKVRVLEEYDSAMRASLFSGSRDTPRVRFVNYYTACTGYKKRRKSSASVKSNISGTQAIKSDDKDTISSDSVSNLTLADPKPQKEMELTHSEREEIRLAQERERMAAEGRRLRGEPEPPLVPVIIAPEPITDETVADTQSAGPSRAASVVSDTDETRSSYSTSTGASKSEKVLKERRFCNLPPADSNGVRDPCWVKVFMENVDEVGAHCGLFFPDNRYDQFFGEIAMKIEEWVREDGDARLARDLT